MQPYTNFQQYPMYQNSMYQPLQMNPSLYQDRFNQPMQGQFSRQEFPLNGKTVETLDNITASDVPMDGNFAIFPKKDLSEIYIKYWTGDGKIATITFKQVLSTGSSNSPSEQNGTGFVDINDVLDRLVNKVDNMSTKIDEVLKPKSSKTKKEVIIDE